MPLVPKRFSDRDAISRVTVVSSPKASPGEIGWDYDRGEIIADGIVHATGIFLGLIGAIMIVVVSVKMQQIELAPILIYAGGLIAMLVLSACYNMWPISPTKWILRRFDHSAIYLLIAGTYTPFLAQMKTGFAAAGLMIAVWATALVGAGLKLLLPGRFDRLSIAFYLLLGWRGVIAYRPIAAVLPSPALWLLAIGGVLYSAGVAFHVWERLRFQ